jgi:hypothetical protein
MSVLVSKEALYCSVLVDPIVWENPKNGSNTTKKEIKINFFIG